ncbi:MAG: hypothetical protein HYT80_01725 [Euryarchaeota archaeon]|nr:hypothetical protein [Euryarchaeota archaeon]
MVLGDDARRRFFIFGGILLVAGLAFDADQVIPNNPSINDEDTWRLVWVLVDLAITVVGGALFLVAYVNHLEANRPAKPSTKG